MNPKLSQRLWLLPMLSSTFPALCSATQQIRQSPSLSLAWNMDPATALQTATAAVSVVQLAFHTYLFVKEVANAQSKARLLSQKTHRLYRLVKAVETRLHIREQLRGVKPAPPEEAEIEEIVRDNFVAVTKGLLSINRNLRGLKNDEPLDLTAKVYKSLQFTLSATNINKQEKAAETNIQALSTALHLLQLLEHAGTQK